MKEKYKVAFMKMAKVFSETSEAERLKVCCLLVKNGQIISIGINGTISGWHTNSCEGEDGKTEWFVKHAEIQALNKLRKSHETSVGATMFITHSPCTHCMLDILDSGVSEVYYAEEYRDTSAIDFLKGHGLVVEKILI